MKQKVLIIGAGLTGQSAMRYLLNHEQLFDVYDSRAQASIHGIEQLKNAYPNSRFYFDKQLPKEFQRYHRAIVSPGVKPSLPIIQALQQHNIPIWGDIEVFARNNRKPVIAITGTNGKSTVTCLVGAILSHQGLKVRVAGNIGDCVLDQIDRPCDVWVLELSSFQLAYQGSLAATVAAILNITEDHLDWHPTMEDYIAAKHRIYEGAHAAVYNLEDKKTHPTIDVPTSLAVSNKGNTAPFHYNSDGLFYFKQQPLFHANDLTLFGEHQWLNVLTALTIGHAYGLSPEQMIDPILTFKGLPHRSEVVRKHKEVTWINDSKGTNVGASIAALVGNVSEGQDNCIWIAGGVGKEADFCPLGSIAKQRVKQAILIGTDKTKIADSLDGMVNYQFADSLEDAVQLADQLSTKGDIVLFSPACASFDMFSNYVHRGEVFMQLVNTLQ